MHSRANAVRKHFKQKYTLHYKIYIYMLYMLGLHHSHVITIMRHLHLTCAVKEYHESESESKGSSLQWYLTAGWCPEAWRGPCVRSQFVPWTSVWRWACPGLGPASPGSPPRLPGSAGARLAPADCSPPRPHTYRSLEVNDSGISRQHGVYIELA